MLKTLVATMTIAVLVLGAIACAAPTPAPTPTPAPPATPTPVPLSTIISDAIAAIGEGQIGTITGDVADLVCGVASGFRPPLALEDFTDDWRIILAVKGYCALR